MLPTITGLFNQPFDRLCDSLLQIYGIDPPLGEIRRTWSVWLELSHLMADARLLQEILLHTGTFNHSVLTEEDLQIFPKATGVVVADRFSVSERCVGQNRDVRARILILLMCVFKKALVACLLAALVKYSCTF